MEIISLNLEKNKDIEKVKREAKVLAAQYWAIHSEFVAVGFTNDQAFSLLLDVMDSVQ